MVERYQRSQGLSKQGSKAPQQTPFDAGAKAQMLMGQQISDAGKALAQAAVFLREKRAAVEMASARAWATRQVNDFLLEASSKPGDFAQTAKNFQELRNNMNEQMQGMFTDGEAKGKFMNEFMPLFYENARFKVAEMTQNQERDYTLAKAETLRADAVNSGDIGTARLAVESVHGLIPESKYQALMESTTRDTYRSIEFSRMKASLASGEDWEVAPETKESLGEIETQKLEAHWRELKRAAKYEEDQITSQKRDDVTTSFYDRIDRGAWVSREEIYSHTKPDADGHTVLSGQQAHALWRASEASRGGTGLSISAGENGTVVNSVIDAIGKAKTMNDLNAVSFDVITLEGDKKISSTQRRYINLLKGITEDGIKNRQSADSKIKTKRITSSKAGLDALMEALGTKDSDKAEVLDMFYSMAYDPSVGKDDIDGITAIVAREIATKAGKIKEGEDIKEVYGWGWFGVSEDEFGYLFETNAPEKTSVVPPTKQTIDPDAKKKAGNEKLDARLNNE